jgi:diguanylate cyclase (GGDEF)-like protein
MIENHLDLRQLLRTDNLTGVGNMIGFYESLYSRLENETNAPFSLLSIDIMELQAINEQFGRSIGDSTIRWFALVLSEETKGEVFRLGGDEFAVILSDCTSEKLDSVLDNLYTRLNAEAPQAHLTSPGAFISVVNFKDLTEWSLVRILGIFNYVLDKKREKRGEGYKVYEAEQIPELKGLNTSTFDMIEKLARVGDLLDQSLQLAYTDSLSGLPNMNAALLHLEQLKESLKESEAVFSLFLIDGDNLGEYNKISYKHGDDMIRQMGATLKQGVRPDDYIARWRAGDEFIIILPDTPLEEAQFVGNRLKELLKQASGKWELPITISIGAVSYPENGNTVNELIGNAEKALRKAKEQGKDCVAIIGTDEIGEES